MSGAEDNDADSVVPPQESQSLPLPPRKRKAAKKPCCKKGPYVLLTQDQERDLAEWLEMEVPFVYNKGMKAHSDRHKVTRAFEEKAAQLEPPITGTQLATWYDSIRTRYGRITNPEEKSGQGAPKALTLREQWIKETFSFLRCHIIRQRKTKVLGMEVCNLTFYLVFCSVCLSTRYINSIQY